MEILRESPTLDLEFRESIFKGQVFLYKPSKTSIRLIEDVKDKLTDILQVENIRQAGTLLTEEVFFERIGKLRKIIYLDDKYRNYVRDLICECGIEPEKILFEPFRLRAICSQGHKNMRAAPVYFPHRDTWYAHPQCLIVYWVPLHDVQENETFTFYPDYFAKEVLNNSEAFNYDDWIKNGPELKIGWQKRDSGITAIYPRSEAAEQGSVVHFSCLAGEQLYFAGAHYHATLPQNTGQTRYSLDMRLVHLDDLATGRGAPNIDNRSQGDSLKDYFRIR